MRAALYTLIHDDGDGVEAITFNNIVGNRDASTTRDAIALAMEFNRMEFRRLALVITIAIYYCYTL